MRRAIALGVLLGAGLAHADVPPAEDNCAAKAAGEACTAHGVEGTCTEMQIQVRGPVALAKAPGTRMVCAVAPRAPERKSGKALVIAAGCAVAAVAIALVGRGWTKGDPGTPPASGGDAPKA